MEQYIYLASGIIVIICSFIMIIVGMVSRKNLKKNKLNKNVFEKIINKEKHDKEMRRQLNNIKKIQIIAGLMLLVGAVLVYLHFK